MRLLLVALLFVATNVGAFELYFERDVRNESYGWRVTAYTVYRVRHRHDASPVLVKIVKPFSGRSTKISIVERGCYFVTTWAKLREETEQRESSASKIRCN